MSSPVNEAGTTRETKTTRDDTGSRKYRPSASLLLTRWLSSRRVDRCEGDEACMECGKAPPVEEPNCYAIHENYCEERTEPDEPVTREYLRLLVREHTKRVSGRTHLLDDLETSKHEPEDLENTLATCGSREINALLLHASFLGRVDLLERLIASGADPNHREEERGLRPLHFASYVDSPAAVRCLLSRGARLVTPETHGPFHYAAYGDAVAVARYYLELGAPRDSNRIEESVLHSAARVNSPGVLKLLAPNDDSLNRLDAWGYGPIHRVAEQGDPASLVVLVEAGARLNLATKRGDTALHLAAESGSHENLEYLVNAGADLAVRNQRGQSPLHSAARAHSLECLEILLRMARCDVNAEDNEARTPLHLSLGRSQIAYDLAETLIAHRADVNRPDRYGYTPLHVAALNELSRCVDLLIHHGADLSARTRGGTSALSIILRKTPTSLSVFKQRLDASLSLHQQSTAAGEIELRLDFHALLQHRREGEIGYLGTFVEEGYKEILEHPLCQSFLYLKWQKIRKYYVGRLFFYLLYVLVLTAWVMTALAQNCYNESHGQLDENSTMCDNSNGSKGFLRRYPVILEIEWYSLVVLTILEGIRKATGVPTYPSFRQFFAQPDNVVEWCVVLSVFAISFVYTGRTYTWQSHVGAFAVLCGWSNLMLMIGQLPMFGAYVAMFTSVQAQVFKLLLAYACLLVGFTASFCVIFPRSKSFSSPHTGLIKVLVMMTGELDFEDLFFPGEEDGPRHADVGSTSWILLQVSAQLSFVLFLLFVTIVLMNLLVGIAVHDIKGLQKTAGLAKLVRQTKLICDVESALLLAMLPNKIMRIVRWTTLVLPSPLRAVLTVRPLNPREKRLPADVLAAAYRVAKHRKYVLPSDATKRFTDPTTLTALGRRRSEAFSALRRVVDDDPEDTIAIICQTNTKLRMANEIADLARICEDNKKLIEDLAALIAKDERLKTPE